MWGKSVAVIGAPGLALVTILYLGLNGGAYDVVVWGEVGLALWWVVLLGAAVGLLPVTGLGRAGSVALGLLAALAVWTGLSTAWGESAERAAIELARVVTYLGAFLLALAAARAGHHHRLLGAVTAAVAAVGLLALLSRLHPAWFPADQAAELLSERNRLDYPLGYFNALAALLALGIVLLLGAASGARAAAWRALAAAAIPALALALYFTLSRGGAAVALAGALVLLALTPRRLPLLGTLIVSGAGSAVLIAFATRRPELEAGLDGAQARAQGDELLLLTIVACALAAAGQVAIDRLTGDRSLALPRLGRAQAVAAAGAGLLLLAVLFVSLGGASAASDQWDEFREPAIAEERAGDSRRLAAVSSRGRYQLWESAVDAADSAPVAGIGAGSFEFWWQREGSLDRFVRGPHSLYLESLAELGVVGLLLTAGFVLLVLGAGSLRAVRAAEDRAVLAAATAGCAAFALSAAVEWVWKIAVLPVAFFVLAGVALGAAAPREGPPDRPAGRSRLATGAVAILALVAIVPPLAATSAVRASEEDVAQGRLAAGLDHARTAASLQPYAATPRLQEALIEERLGRLDRAAEAATEATDAEPTNWRPWVVLSRIEARRGRAADALMAYLEARSLNPRSFLFPD